MAGSLDSAVGKALAILDHRFLHVLLLHALAQNLLELLVRDVQSATANKDIFTAYLIVHSEKIFIFCPIIP